MKRCPRTGGDDFINQFAWCGLGKWFIGEHFQGASLADDFIERGNFISRLHSDIYARLACRVERLAAKVYVWGLASRPPW